MEGPACDGSCKGGSGSGAVGWMRFGETPAGRIHIISVSMAAGAGEGRGADGAEGCGAGPA